jgi:8-oxo-dGTP pyrophosphatase MutT (NUDIX family)
VRARVVHLPERTDPDGGRDQRGLDDRLDGGNGADGPGGWPDGLMSAREALAQGFPGWPGPGETPPDPPVPVPAGRGGEQRIPRPFNARPGGPPPWAGVAPELRQPTLADVRAALTDLGPPHPALGEHGLRAAAGADHSDRAARPSAVLAPLYEADGEAFVVLTRRTWRLSTHQGEMSFPGGRIDPGETPVDGALREAKEEIDLDPSTVELIAELDHLTAVSSRSFIVPFVGALPGRPELRPNPYEVEAVRHVPLAELADPAMYREEIWTFPDGMDRSIYFFELVGDTVWGMTAALLRQLLGMVTHTLGRGDLGHP